jgi:acetyl-CoA carboxylase alpha subunit
MRLTAADLQKAGVADIIVREPRVIPAGKAALPRALRPALRRVLEDLRSLDTDELLRRRTKRYRGF